MSDDREIDITAKNQRMLEEFDRLHNLITQQAGEIHQLCQRIKDYDLEMTNLQNQIEAFKKQMATDFETIQKQRIQIVDLNSSLDYWRKYRVAP